MKRVLLGLALTTAGWSQPLMTMAIEAWKGRLERNTPTLQPACSHRLLERQTRSRAGSSRQTVEQAVFRPRVSKAASRTWPT